MGHIIGTKAMPDKSVICKILMDADEIENLKGHLKNIQIFSEDFCRHESQINTRGNNGVTKYFKIPLNIRSRKKHNGQLSYQRIETPSKIFYIYTLQRDNEQKEQREEIQNSE